MRPIFLYLPAFLYLLAVLLPACLWARWIFFKTKRIFSKKRPFPFFQCLSSLRLPHRRYFPDCRKQRGGGVCRTKRVAGWLFCACLLDAGGLKAQEGLSLPFGLQAAYAGEEPGWLSTAGNPALTMLNPQPQAPFLFAGCLARMGFIKENAVYSLDAGLLHGKNAWTLHYQYKGYPVLNQQQSGLGYARNFLPGFSAGIGIAYLTSNKIEDRVRESLIELRFSTAFQHKIWSFNFKARYPVVLRSEQRKEWNRALSLQIGTAIRVFDQIQIGADLYKDLRYPLQAGIALGYLFKERFLIYGQTRINPLAYQLGFAYTRPALHIEVNCGYNPPLGFESSAGVVWKHLFNPRKKSTRPDS